MYPFHRVCRIAALATALTGRLASAGEPTAPAAGSPTAVASGEKCFENAGLKTTITIRLHDTGKDDVAGVFESASNREEDAARQSFAFTGHREHAKSANYRIAFAGDRPETLRKHKQLTWKLVPHPPGETLIINLYGPRLDGKKPAFIFYDVELQPCAKAK